MPLAMMKLYGALRAANVPDEQASAAAEEAAGYENRLQGVERTLAVHTWILSVNTALLLALIGLALKPHF